MGIRNTLAVVYTVECAKVVAARIARQFKGTQLFGRHTGCSWSEPMFSRLAALGKHPNVGAVLVVGLGCEYIEAHPLATEIATSGKPVASLVITESGGTLKPIEAGCRLLEDLAEQVSRTPRAPISPAQLIVAMDCAGSDATSGPASNPAVGVAADKLVQDRHGRAQALMNTGVWGFAGSGGVPLQHVQRRPLFYSTQIA